MASLKQRLELLRGHYVKIHRDGDWDDEKARGKLVEIEEDYVGIAYQYPLPGDECWFLVLMARVIHIEHDTTMCPLCKV